MYMLRDLQKLHDMLYICAIMIASVYVFDIDCNNICFVIGTEMGAR